MPRRSDRLLSISVNNEETHKKHKHKIHLQIRSHVVKIHNFVEYGNSHLGYTLYHIYCVYDILYKNFYTCWTNNIRPSFIRSAYLHIRVIMRDINTITNNPSSVLTDPIKSQIQRVYNIFKRFRQLYDNERTYLFTDILNILPKLNPDVIYHIDTFL